MCVYSKYGRWPTARRFRMTEAQRHKSAEKAATTWFHCFHAPANMAEPSVYDCTSGRAELLAIDAEKSELELEMKARIRALAAARAGKEELGCWRIFQLVRDIHAQRPGTRFQLLLNGTLWTAESPTKLGIKYLAVEWIWRKEGTDEQVGLHDRN